MSQPEIWPMLGAGAGAIGVGATLMLHIVQNAYKQGQTDQRLGAIEKTQSALGDAHTVLSALTATVDALKDSVERLDRALENINRRVFTADRPQRDA
jgi:hypothetical protein